MSMHYWRKKVSETASIGEAKVARLTAHYNAWLSWSIYEHTIQETIGYGTMQQMSYSYAFIGKASSLTMLRSIDQWERIARSDESFIIHHIDGCFRVYYLPDKQLACGRTYHESCRLCEHHCGPVEFLFFLTGNGVFQQNQHSMLQSSNCAEVVPKT